jgi:hypothetical protein
VFGPLQVVEKGQETKLERNARGQDERFLTQQIKNNEFTVFAHGKQ